jgi:predicted CoA-substrate-specific enzyme activase
MVLLDAAGTVVHEAYERHHAQVLNCLQRFLNTLEERLGDAPLSVCMTGSVGLGVAERLDLAFVQEVVAAAQYMKVHHPEVVTMIDIGGEDAKIVFFSNQTPDLRMNGNCAGGTGAFIDQMAILIGVTPDELGQLAEEATQVYTIASRCGVFCKTDVQNLVARGVSRADIAASIFHAVAVQTVTTLAHGHDITGPILLCGGPLTFIPALRKAFADYLQLSTDQFLLPERAHLIPAWGAALAPTRTELTLSDFRARLADKPKASLAATGERPEPIFTSEAEYAAWQQEMSRHAIDRAPWPKAGSTLSVYLGVDSGSTTTKIIVLDPEGRLLYSYYHNNDGNPVAAVERGLQALADQCREHGVRLQVAGSCSTGYGEDLIQTAFHMDGGVVETMAHYRAARQIASDVSFILDIGGQDMKAMFIEHGAINRIEVNEACSSGCGSFISTFATSMNCSVADFARAACLAPHPCDLGTRCTVFMNSKVKQVLREGVSTADIAAGLSYSVIKNCLYKVLRLKDTSTLGDRIVVQGGTMRNDSVVRALEKLTGRRVFRSDCPELMGAYGCALSAMQLTETHPISLDEMLSQTAYTTSTVHCHGCENQCVVTRYKFSEGRLFFSGNRCEKIFNNQGGHVTPGRNAYEEKRRLLFDRTATPDRPLLTIGIPRCLNMYEEYPFWHTLLTECNIAVRLSEVSNVQHYEQCAGKVMSDNICFPAKLAHSHIDNLVRQGVDRILMPFVVYEKGNKQTQNSYNCPVVTGYSQVVKSVQTGDIPIDTPTFSFKEDHALFHQCVEYLRPLGVSTGTVRAAVKKARAAQADYECAIAAYNEQLLAEARQEGRLIILLAGRPYHADALIQHKVSEMVAAQGACVLTDDLMRGRDVDLTHINYLSQWAFPNRIVQAALWVAGEDDRVQFMQLTSFGCGPDAFLTDEVQARLHARGKNLTLLKIDDVNNIGSLKLRVRSLIESLKAQGKTASASANAPGARSTMAPTTPPFTKADVHRKIIVPFFTPYISPLIPSVLRLAGYDVETLPMSDAASCDWGLKFSNNEVCYPATLIVGDVVKSFKSGLYDPDQTCVAMTQTGGQCRASNYLALIRKALIENGYRHTPVISVTFGDDLDNNQPGFKVHWIKLLPILLAAVLYGDCIAKFFHAAVVRETTPGAAARLRDDYMTRACAAIERNCPDELYAALEQAAADFDAICRTEAHPKVGIVGEIFLKFNPFAQKHVTDWLVAQGIEVVYPSLLDFFLQAFVNAKDIKKTHLGHKFLPNFIIDALHRKTLTQLRRVNRIGSHFRYFIPFDDIFEKAEQASSVISLSAQFGEGWLIAGEVATLARQGVTHVVSLQPFGCIANHIVGKGIENRLKRLYPQLNLLSLDFDSSVSEVNITNRLLLFINTLKEA